MTECVYEKPLASFFSDVVPASVEDVPVLSEGSAAIEKANKVQMAPAANYWAPTIGNVALSLPTLSLHWDPTVY